MTRFSREIANRSSLIIDFEFPKKSFNDYDEKNLTLLNSLFYMIVIDSYSYLAEYEQVFGSKTENEFKQRIIDVKTINKSFINKIKEWKDMGDLRNHLLAHNLRQGKNGQFIFAIDNLDYNAPRTINDIFLLSNLVGLMTQIINFEFIKEVKGSTKESLKNNVMTGKTMTKDEVSTITVNLINQATSEISRLKKTYSFEIKAQSDWDKL